MTDRYKGVIVAFDSDVREDDAQAVITAIRQLRGVADVQAQVAGPVDPISRMRVDAEWRDRIYKLISESE